MVHTKTTEVNGQDVTEKDVLLYVPNLIGYLRIVTALIAFACMKNHPIYTLSFYGVSGFLDAFDGYAARKFNQGTRFGAVLDMVTDRCSTTALTCFLVYIYPQFCLLWQVLVCLDFGSHYMHMYAMMASGSGSHKNVEETQSKVLSLYYSNRVFLFFVCCLNELFYVAVYMSYFNFFWFGTVVVYISAPVWLFKQFANVIQLRSAAHILANLDAKDKTNEKKKVPLYSEKKVK